MKPQVQTLAPRCLARYVQGEVKLQLPHLAFRSCSFTLSCLPVVKMGLWSLSRELCKTGCPVGQRRELWSHALGVDLTTPHVRHGQRDMSHFLIYSQI